MTHRWGPTSGRSEQTRREARGPGVAPPGAQSQVAGPLRGVEGGADTGFLTSGHLSFLLRIEWGQVAFPLS